MRDKMARVAALLSVLAIFLYFAAHFDPHEEEVYRGFSGQARIDPLFAARRFLTDMGFKAQSSSDAAWLDELDARTEVLFIYVDSALNDPARVERALAWARGGGHLVLSLQRPRPGFDSSALLRTKFGVSETKLSADADKAEAKLDAGGQDTNGDGTKSKSGRKSEMSIRWTSSSATLSVARDLVARLQSNADLVVAARDRHGALVVQGEAGAGQISFIYNTAWFSNWSINKHDHARLLYQLLAPSYQGGLVHFVIHNYAPDSILELIWRNASRALIAFAAILILFVASRIRRFGPLQLEPEPVERSLKDQLTAQAELIRSRNAMATLADLLAANLESKLKTINPGWERLELTQRIHYLVSRYHVEDAVVQDALGYGLSNPQGRTGAWRRLRSIESLRSKL